MNIEAFSNDLIVYMDDYPQELIDKICDLAIKHNKFNSRQYWLMKSEQIPMLLIGAPNREAALEELADGMDSDVFLKFTTHESFQCAQCTGELLLKHLSEADDGYGWSFVNDVSF
jgi:hypothetical protein